MVSNDEVEGARENVYHSLDDHVWNGKSVPLFEYEQQLKQDVHLIVIGSNSRRQFGSDHCDIRFGLAKMDEMSFAASKPPIGEGAWG